MARDGQWTVLQSCSSPAWGGLEMQALQECIELRKESLNVLLICHPQSRLENEARLRNIPTLPLVLRDFPDPFGIAKLRRAITGREVDIAHSQISKDLWTLAPAVRFAPKPIPLLLTKRIGSFILKKDPLHRWIYGQLDQVFAISEVIRKNLIETCPLPSTKVEVLHDGVDLDLFSPTRVNARRIRKEFNVGRKRFLIGMVGRFSPGKGHEDFLGALKILREKHPQVMALIVGEASHGEHEYEERIRSLASQMGLDDVVVFTGFRKDIPEILASLDLFVFPSHAEAFGDVVIEAMAMQKPIVSTNCDGVTDIVVDGETGIQVPPRDPNALARAIALLVKDNRRRERYGKASLKRVRSNFNLKDRTSYLIKTYKRLLKEKLIE